MKKWIGMAIVLLVLATLACGNVVLPTVEPTTVPGGGQQPPGGGQQPPGGGQQPPGGGKPGGEQPPGGGQQPPGGGQPTPGGGQQPPGGGNATIVMHNNSGQTVVYAYVSPCTDTTWGNDDLGAFTVPNGGTFTFQVPAGCYDLKAEGSGNTLIETEMGVNVSGTYHWYIP